MKQEIPPWRGLTFEQQGARQEWYSPRKSGAFEREDRGAVITLRRGTYIAALTALRFVTRGEGMTPEAALADALAQHRARVRDDLALLERLFGSEGK
jgi:hypothetical protein